MAEGVVLKPVSDERFAAWHADVMDAIEERDFRVARPVRADNGGWVVSGWTASTWIPGRQTNRWDETIDIGAAFHDGLRSMNPPPWLHDRNDRWTVGDRVAWEELPSPALPPAFLEPLALLSAARTSTDLPAQIIHGDLTHNVLYAPGFAPAVIDLAPYVRPVGFASAVVVADALLWFGGDRALARSTAARVEMFGQLLTRALIYRLVTNGLFGASTPPENTDDAVRIATALAN